MSAVDVDPGIHMENSPESNHKLFVNMEEYEDEDGGDILPVKEQKKVKKKKKLWGSMKSLAKLSKKKDSKNKEKLKNLRIKDSDKDNRQTESADEERRPQLIKKTYLRKGSNRLLVPEVAYYGSDTEMLFNGVHSSVSDMALNTVLSRADTDNGLDGTASLSRLGLKKKRKPLSVRKRFLERKQSRQSSADSDITDGATSGVDENSNQNASPSKKSDGSTENILKKTKSSTLSLSPSEEEAANQSAPDLQLRSHSMDGLQGDPSVTSYYRLEVHLREGKDLAVRDWSGSSDPYVKFKLGGKLVYKSRIIYQNLNPHWDEKFHVPVRNIHQTMHISVLDYDVGPVSDDPMGKTKLDINSLEPSMLMEQKLELKEGNSNEYLGYLLIDFKLVPISEGELNNISSRRKQQSDAKRSTVRGNSKSQLWTSVVTIVLLEGKNLIPMDDNGLSDPYVKFKLAGEKFKSKVESKTLDPKWMEQFDLRIYEELSKMLEISVWDKDVGKDDIMGRGEVDLSILEPERTHSLKVELEDDAGVLDLLLTISGTSGAESISDLEYFQTDPNRERELIKRYSLKNSLKDVKDVGWLQVKVIRAHNLASADIGGKSDPFCVLELVNARLQTQTVYKTLNPDWGKVFTFQVKDIHSVLEVTVLDEDKHGSPEFLGKVAVPLLRIRNGEKRLYALKDKKLQRRAKGSILLEMEFIYNDIKAAIRTVNPTEVKYMEMEQKFKIAILQQNLSRVTAMVGHVLECGKFINSCFQWDSKPRTLTAFFAFLIIVWNFELFMAPIAILLLFLWKYIECNISERYSKVLEEEEYADSEDEEEDGEEKDKEGRRSLSEKLHTIERVCQTIQNKLDEVACLGERIKNTFNFTVPWLSWLAILALCVVATVLYLIPIRYLILAWGINKFTKKLRKPHAIPNNELLDFLSRVPSDGQLKNWVELRPELLRQDTPKKKR